MQVKTLEIKLHELKCSNCGATLKYHPGQQSVICPYCGTENKITFSDEQYQKAWEEKDFELYLQKAAQENVDTEEKMFIKCPGCGAQIQVSDKTISTQCPYCGTQLVLEQSQIQRVIKPQAVIPFNLDKKQAKQAFLKWAKSRWLAPARFKKYITAPSKLHGLYIPYWTFDADTVTDYTGERGDYYYVTVTYTNSQGETETREEQRIRWTPVSGTVRVKFDDILVSGKIDNKLPKKVSSWNLKDLQPYDPALLAGFESEAYTVTLPQAFNYAKNIMKREIRQAIYRDIGGDQQRIHSMKTYYYDVTFKHILLPAYLSTFRYKNKIYPVAINGQTGKVAGKYPVSVGKVILLVLLALILIGLIVLFFGYNGDVNQMWHSIFGFVNLLPDIHALYPV